MNIFKKRFNFKPFEYDILKYREAIRLSRWDVEEFDFGEDIQDFHTKLLSTERNVIKNTMLAISQVEADTVKTFWVKLLEWLPKAEIAMVGITFGENEITHSLAYSKLLEILGFNDEFINLKDNPIMKGRVDYLNEYLFSNKEGYSEDQLKVIRLALFSLFVENVSLFSQFAIIKSFRKHKDYLKSIDNVVLSTQKDELVHAKFGIELINIIKRENPDWFNDEFYDKIYKASHKAYKAEEKIIDWIFEQGDLEFITANQVKEFTKSRFNSSLKEIGGKSIFKTDEEELKALKWFEEEIYGYTRNDFFNTKSSNYNKVKVKVDSIIKAVRRIQNEVV